MMQTRRVNTDDLIARCVGEAGLGTNNQGTNRQFELAYNATEDSVQVVNLTNGSFVCDVLQFQGTVSNVDGRQISRLAFVFIPEANEAVGSAALTDRVHNRNDRRNLRGQINFALPDLELGSAAGAQFSPAPITNTNGVGTTNNAGAGGTGTNTTITSPVVPVPPVVNTNSTIIVTNNLTSPGNVGLTNSITPPLPGSATSTVPTNSASGTATNSVVTIGGSTGNPVPSPVSLLPDTTNSVVTPMADLTTPVVSAALTNAVGSSTFTNGVICSGTVSVGKRIPVR